MRAVVQRVSRAQVRVAGRIVGAVDKGFCVLVGAGVDDGPDDVAYLVDKVVGLRIFEDDAGKMNLALADVGGAVLAVSQFTLYGDARKGRRPAFTQAMAWDPAHALFEAFVAGVSAAGITVAAGEFGADMDVELVNAGPVTLLLDSRRGF